MEPDDSNSHKMLSKARLTLLVAGSWLPLLVAGGVVKDPPLISPVLTGRFLKFKRHSIHLNMIYISKKKKFQKFVEGGIRGQKP